MGPRGVDDTKRALPMESTEQVPWKFKETETATIEPAWACTKSYAHVMVVSCIFWGRLLTVGVE